MMSSTPVASPFEGWRGLLSITPDQLERLTATKPLRFIVGHNKTEFTIHTSLLPPLSAPLTALARGELKKSPDCYVTLEEIGEDVFLRFMQFLYTGTYMSFQRDEKEEPSKQVEAVSQMTASISEELSDQTVQETPMGLDQSPCPPCATSSTIHRGSSKDSSHCTTLFDGGQVSDQESLSKPLSQALGTPTTTGGLFGGLKQQQPSTSLFGSGVGTTGGLFGGSKQQQPSYSLFGSGVGTTGGLFGGLKQQQHSTSLFGSGVGTTGGLFGGSNQHQPHTGLFSSVEMSNASSGTAGGQFGGVEVSNTGFGGSPSLKRKLALASTLCDCGPSKKKREYLSDFAQKYCGAIIDQGNIHCKPKTETLPFKFIGHARLWVFSNSFDITALMDLASSQLALELAQWGIWPSSFVSEFGDLVRYVYKNCPTGECRLTQIVAQYAACVAEDVCGLKGWSILLKEVPNFAADLVDQMTSRLG
ncbi:hypothetical protein ACJZ2D_016425 [Fusarium nematophilum]